MAPYSEFRDRLLGLLGAEPDTLYDRALLYTACSLASNAILPWCPNQMVDTVTVEADHLTATLPVDCWRVEAVQDDETGLILPKLDLRPGVVRRVAGRSYNDFTDWSEHPKGSLRLSNKLSTSRSLTVFYLAYWEKPADKDDTEFELPMPEAAITGMLYWAGAYCMVPGSASSAQIRQFNTKVDSGTPVDNSLEVEAKFLKALFMDEMKQLPKFIGATQ